MATSCDFEENQDYFLIRYSVSCPDTCPTKSVFTLYVMAGIQNPLWIPTSNLIYSIEVTTYTSDLLYQIDQKTSNVFASPNLEEG